MHENIVRKHTLARLVAGLTIAVAIAGPAAGALEAQETPFRIGVVDIEFIAARSPAGQTLATEIEALRVQYAQELAAREAEVGGIQARVAAADSTDLVTLRALQREYQDALTNFQRYQQDVQAQAQDFQTQGLQRVREEIGPAIEAIMEEEGYDLILNMANTAIIMSSERIDVTQKVLDRLAAAGSGG
jgi:Skp family chaperone for outer membrane proteins